jgi:DNA-binding transcriptional regulator YdaS (Cro superfamily)
VTAREFRYTLTIIGCGGRTLARWLGISPRTVERWAAGDLEVEPRVAAWLADLVHEIRVNRIAAEVALAAMPLPENWT